MKKRDNIYRHYQKQVKDKDTSTLGFMERTLVKTQSMFHYTGLPDTLPKTDLERLLQTEGKVFVTKVDGEIYAFVGGQSGEPDVYGHPTQIIVTNTALNLSKTFDVKEDGVLMKNDSNGESLLPLIGKYAVLYTDSTISLNTASILTRITMLISASDDKTQESAEVFLQKILDGDFSVIGENSFFKGITLQNGPTNTGSHLKPLIELVQYVKASLLNELGLNANFNMKRERLNTSEVNMNDAVLLPYVDNMLYEREVAVQKINEMFGTEITVTLASSWQVQHDSIHDEVTPNSDNEPDETIEPNEPNETDEPDEPIEPNTEVEPDEPDADTEPSTDVEPDETDEPDADTEPNTEVEPDEDDEDDDNK